MRRLHVTGPAALVLSTVLLMGLAACGDDDDSGTAATAAPAATTAAPAATTAAAAATTAAAGGGSTEIMKSISFTVKEVHVAVGGNVVFDNQDTTTHTATADDGSFDTGHIDAGSKKTVAFPKAGTFTFHCSIHPTMKASVVVA